MPRPRHGHVQGALFMALAPCRRSWYFGSEIQVDFGPDQQFLPDVAGWLRDRAPEPDVCPTTVVPDWVCEILSASTARRDRGTKQRSYHRAGVAHYWLLDPARRSLLVLRRGDADYDIALTAEANDVVHAPPFSDIALALPDLFEA